MTAAFRFPDDFKRRLAELRRLVASRSGICGEAGRRGRTPGQVEFRDHRAYAPGDDARLLDWNVFLRSDTLATKTFTQEDAPAATIVLDRSASMGPPGSRQDGLGREIAAAFGWLALQAGGEAVLHPSPRRHRGVRAQDAWLAEVAAAPDPAGSDAVLAGRAARARGGQVALWISDFLGGAAFSTFAPGARERSAVILCAHDDPLSGVPQGAVATFADPEGGRLLRVRNDAAWRAEFQAVRAEHVDAVVARARRHGVSPVAASADVAFEAVVMELLRP